MVVHPGDWLQLDMAEWQIALATPGINLQADIKDLRSFELRDSEGVLLIPVTQGSHGYAPR
jgi:hypothetical protein